ncbi:hypothetical protein LXL04_031639 [Taraxacum kok-saghyz]
MHQNQTPKAPTNSNKYQIPIQKKAAAKTAQNLSITNRGNKVKSAKNNNRKTIAAANTTQAIQHPKHLQKAA